MTSACPEMTAQLCEDRGTGVGVAFFSSLLKDSGHDAALCDSPSSSTAHRQSPRGEFRVLNTPSREKMKLSHVFPLQGSCTAERYHRFGCSIFRRRLGAYSGGPTVFVIRFCFCSSWLPIHSPTAVSLLWQKSGRCLRGSAISVNQHPPLLHLRYELVQSFRVSHVSFMPAAMPRVRP